MKEFLKKNAVYLTAISIFLLVGRAYFHPQTEGKVLKQSDLVENTAMKQESKEHIKKTGEVSLWTNSMFGGMPIYQISPPAGGNVYSKVEPMLRLNIPRPLGRFFLLSLGFFVLLAILKVDPWLAIIGGLTFAYNTNNLILMDAGHVTKLVVATAFGLVVGGLYLLFEKRNFLMGFGVILLGLVLNLFGNHVQMTYYLGLTILIYLIIHIIHVFRSKQDVMKTLLIPGGISLGALLISVMTVLPNLWTTYDYSKDTMRGNPILEKTASVQEGQDASSNVKGLAWDYAMQWSNGTKDVLALAIPRAAGGGSAELLGENTKNYKQFKRMLGGGPRRPDGKIQIPTYHGKLPFTVGPTYFGAAVIFLFVLGLFLVEGRMKWWLGISVLFTVLLSYGKNFEFFQRLLFDYVPLYNKFRAPNSVMTVTGFLIPILSFIVVSQILNGRITKEKALTGLKYSLISVGGVMLFVALLGTTFFDFSYASDARYNNEQFVDMLVETRKSLLQKDAFRSLIFVLLAAGVIWAFIKEKIKRPLFIAGIAIVVLTDLLGVSLRYLDHNSFQLAKRVQKVTPRPVDQQILSVEKERGAYRVLDLSINTFSRASTSYFHNTVGGYHPAKLQRIQDIIDAYFNGQINMGVINMLNTKYVIQRQKEQNTDIVQPNPGALGNAWFVDTIRTVATPNEEIDALGQINTATTAVVLDSEFDGYIGDFQPTKNGSISMLEYAPNRIVYETKTGSEQFAVFSEAWYGPDKGWKVKIDNEPAKHIRANYMLRAMRIPSGEHKIEFYFEPDEYYKSTKVSKASSWFSLLIVLAIFGFGFWQKFKNPEPEVVQ